jgi:drug/metabolite transporter (DMT)-like permease
VFITIKGGEWLMPKPSRQYILPMSLMLLMISFGHPTAMKFIPASLASLLFYLWPMLVLVIISVQNRQFPGIRRIAIFSVAFVGLGFVFGPSIGEVRWEGVVAALIAALGAGMFIILIPKATETASSMTININTNIPVALVLLCGAVLYEDFQTPTETMGLYALMASGLLYGLAMVVIFYAVTKTGPVVSSVLFNAEPLIVTLLATTLFAEILQPLQYWGILTVVAAMMFASARSASHEK